MGDIRKIPIGEHWLELDLGNQHEKDYYDYIELGKRNAQIEIDVLFLRTFLDGRCSSMLDIGANIGFVALAALASGFSTVECFEPEPMLFSRLKKLKSGSVGVNPFAVGDRSGKAELFLSKTHNQGHTIDKTGIDRFRQVYGEQIESIEVPMVTLDQQLSAPFDYWKIDVEGLELKVLEGATRNLAENAPNYITIEIYDVNVLQRTNALLAEFGYHCRQMYVMRERPELAFREVPNGNVGIVALNGAAPHAPTFLFTLRQEQNTQ